VQETRYNRSELQHEGGGSALSETIAAIATPPGEGGVGLVRISGSEAGRVLKECFVDARGRRRAVFQPRRLYLGFIINQAGERVDQVLAVYMPRPYSYTGEDVVEISGHGGPLVMRELLNVVLSHGVRLADPGEFTQRAFLAGKIDLTQAEAVIDLIRAKSRSALRQAERHLEGELSRAIGEVRERLLGLLAQIAVSLDYPEEDLPELAIETMGAEVDAALWRLNELLETSFAGRVLREGLNVVIVGRPNVGKSSLLNRLTGKQRAIVTEVPGTTRDVIDEFFLIDGIPIRLVDTAGIRVTDDPVERIGVNLAEEALQQADLALVILDQSVPLEDEDRQILTLTGARPRIVVCNKIDLPQAADLPTGHEMVPVSARTGEGIEVLRQRIANFVLAGKLQPDSLMIVNTRQEQLLRQAISALQDVRRGLDEGAMPDMLEIDLRAAWESLGVMIGEAVREDVVREIFARFCVGK
jgi:tRNA modification GTPase